MDNNTLLLVVNSETGVIPRYQKTIYEAALCGIKNVMYKIDARNYNKEKMLGIREKLDKTCEILKMRPLSSELLGSTHIDRDSVVTTDEQENIINTLVEVNDFKKYKREFKESLRNKKKISKVLIKR